VRTVPADAIINDRAAYAQDNLLRGHLDASCLMNVAQYKRLFIAR
jgi:hypothetical protein